MRRERKRAPGAGRPPGEVGVKSATLSLRLPPDMRTALVAASERNKRPSLSEEIVLRLRSTLGRDRNADRPRHIKALAEMIVLAALGIERVTGRPFNEDRYTALELAKAIDLLLRQYSPKTEAVVPPAVVAAAKAMPAQMSGAYPTQIGVIEAGAVISQLESTPNPPVRKLPPGIYYPESLWGAWQVRENLKPRRRK
jgi:hypothetical protein